MSAPVRMMDLTKELFVEMGSTELQLQLRNYAIVVREKRDAFLEEVETLVKDKEEAVVLLAAVTSNMPLTGKAAQIQDLLKRAAVLTDKMNRITTFANNYAQVPPCVIRMSYELAQDFGL